MSDDDLSKQKNILGLSFRDLEKGIDQPSDEFVFIDDTIGGRSWWDKFVFWLKKSFSPNTDKKGLLSFFSNLSVYIFSRLRVILVLFSIFVDILFKSFENIKDIVVRRSFWGRGGFFIYVTQVSLSVIAIIIIVSSIYRNPAIISANE